MHSVTSNAVAEAISGKWVEDGNFSYCKRNNIVTVMGSFTANIANTWTSLFTLPIGYRPRKGSYKCLFASSGSRIVNAYIGTNGVIEYYSTQSINVEFDFTYIV